MEAYAKERHATYQEAATFIGDEHARLVKQLETAAATMPSFGPIVDEIVRRYINASRQGVIGSVHWCLESPRYFGTAVPTNKSKVTVDLWERNADH